MCLYISNVHSSSPVTTEYAQKAQVYLLAPSIYDLREKSQVSVTCLLLGHRLNDFSITWKVGDDPSPQTGTTGTPTVLSNGTESVHSYLNVLTEKWNAYTQVSCQVKHLCSSKAHQYNISKNKGKCSHKY